MPKNPGQKGDSEKTWRRVIEEPGGITTSWRCRPVDSHHEQPTAEASDLEGMQT